MNMDQQFRDLVEPIVRELVSDIVKRELEKSNSVPRLVPLEKFCKDVGINRTTLWKAAKDGQIKLQRIGRRVFVDATQEFA